MLYCDEMVDVLRKLTAIADGMMLDATRVEAHSARQLAAFMRECGSDIRRECAAFRSDYTEIPLAGTDAVAIVDQQDYQSLAVFKWHLAGFNRRYPCRNVQLARGRRHTEFMHRTIMNPPAGMQVDHINRNPLDNRRSNLRLCTASFNLANTDRKRSASGFRGVWFFPRNPAKPWRANIQAGGRRASLGVYSTPEQAARAYDAAAIELYGEFANLNFPDDHRVEVRE